MKKILLLIIAFLIAISCKKPVDVFIIEPPAINNCSFDDSVSLENEQPLPEYFRTLEFSECDESIALFRENLNFTGDHWVSLKTDEVNDTITFVNSIGRLEVQDQQFDMIVIAPGPDGDEVPVGVGGGIIMDNIARITNYAPPEASSFFRLFNSNGWLSPYESTTGNFCTDGETGISQDVPALQEIRIDNDSSWGDHVELNYVFDPITGQYEACISGLEEYTVEWSINGRIEHGDDIETIVGKARGIYFIAATIFYNSEHMTLSHNVIKDVTGKNVRRARIRRPTSG